MGVLVHVMLNIIGQIEDLVEFFHTEIQRAHYMSHRVLLFDLYIFFRPVHPNQGQGAYE